MGGSNSHLSKVMLYVILEEKSGPHSSLFNPVTSSPTRLVDTAFRQSNSTSVMLSENSLSKSLYIHTSDRGPVLRK